MTATAAPHRITAVSSLLAVAVVLPLLVFFTDLGTPSLWDPDEGRHAEIAREMLLTREWLSPVLNFEPYREKTPVFYWLVATGLRQLGERNETAPRLPAAAFAVLGVWATIAWGFTRIGPLAGILGGVILATAGGYVGIGRLAFVESVHATLLSIALFQMGSSLTRQRVRFPSLFWLCLAAATAVRGPVAILLAVLVAVGFLAFTRDPRRLLLLCPFRGIAVLAIVLVPLVIAMHDRAPGHLETFVWQNNVGRYVGLVDAGSHAHSVAYYFWMTPLLLLPWGVLLPWILFDSFRSQGEDGSEVRAFLFAWTAVVVAFFTGSAMKLPSYVLPALFPLSLLAGESLATLARRPRPWTVLEDPVLVAGGIVFVGALVSPIVGYRVLAAQFPMYAEKTVYFLLLVPFAASGMTAVLLRNRTAVLGSLALTSTAFLLALYHYGSVTVSAYNSMEIPARLIERKLPENAPILSYRTTSHSLSFYSGKPVRLVESIGTVSGLLNGDAPIALLTKERFLPDVRGALQKTLYVWWEGDSRKMLLANVPPPSGADPRILLPLAAQVAVPAGAE
jgi:4-amino-4-deoxy-L-arabinose transferase-like glycosyltransferase